MGYVIGMTNEELREFLRERDGDFCQAPDCEKPWTDKDPATIDHKWPVAYCRAHGWAEEDIHALDNLSLYHRSCNSVKGDTLPNPDGSLPKVVRLKIKKIERPHICETCNAGRKLKEHEICKTCGGGPKPLPFPRWANREPKDCPHTGPYSCFNCMVGVAQRV